MTHEQEGCESSARRMRTEAVESFPSVLQRRPTVSKKKDLVAVQSKVNLCRGAERQAALRAESTEAGGGPHVLLPTGWPDAAPPQETLFRILLPFVDDHIATKSKVTRRPSPP